MNEILAVRLVDKAHEGLVLCVLRQQTAYLRGSEVECPASFGIEPYLDGFLPAAVDIDGSYPVDILKVGTDLFIYDITYAVYPSRATHLKHHEVVGQLRNIHFLQLHRKTLGESSRQLVHLLLQAQGSNLEVDRILKIYLYIRLPAVDIRLYLIHPAYRTDRPFERDNHLRLYILRIHVLLGRYLDE